MRQALQETSFQKLDPVAKAQHGKEYTKVRNNLIAEWETQTGQVWPQTMRLDKKTGQMKPVRHDVHHIIPQEFGGPREWWNIHPLEGGTAHQAGVHGSNAPLTQIFKDIKK